MMVAVMAQIVTMFRRRPGTMEDAGTVVGDIVGYSCVAEADEKPSRPASERWWPVSMVA
jgi:hypothetical protein